MDKAAAGSERLICHRSRELEPRKVVRLILLERRLYQDGHQTP